MKKLFKSDSIEKLENKRKSRNTKVIFKEYDMSKLMLPQSFEILIPKDHLVRKVNEIVEKLDLKKIYSKYKIGGTSSYHPKMLLKVILYSYMKNIYSGREMEKQLKENIHFMWIGANNFPDFRTINRFRSEVLKEEIDEIFVNTLKYMIEEGFIKAKDYFLDGTKLEANANKYSFVWSKATKKFSDNLQLKIVNLLCEIDEIISEENKIKDKINKTERIKSEDLKEVLSEVEKELSSDKKNKKAKKAKRLLEKDYIPRTEKYEKYEEIAGERNSFSKIDTDATFMRMKEDHMKNGQLKAGYNIQIGTENQFILGYSIHQNPGDSNCLIPHIEKFKKLTGIVPENIIADAGYGSEENYNYLDNNEIKAYVKYNMFHKEDTKKYKNDIYKSSNFKYDEINNEFICPNERRLRLKNSLIKKTENNYETKINYFECESCEGCSHKDKCTKAEANRIIQVNFNLKERRKKAKEMLNSEKGIEFRKQRCIDVEPVFGMIKFNRKFNRFVLRSLKKVNIEWGLISIAHNIKKMWKIMQNPIPNINIIELVSSIFLILSIFIRKFFIKKETNLNFYF